MTIIGTSNAQRIIRVVAYKLKIFFIHRCYSMFISKSIKSTFIKDPLYIIYYALMMENMALKSMVYMQTQNQNICMSEYIVLNIEKA